MQYSLLILCAFCRRSVDIIPRALQNVDTTDFCFVFWSLWTAFIDCCPRLADCLECSDMSLLHPLSYICLAKNSFLLRLNTSNKLSFSIESEEAQYSPQAYLSHGQMVMQNSTQAAFRYHESVSYTTTGYLFSLAEQLAFISREQNRNNICTTTPLLESYCFALNAIALSTNESEIFPIVLKIAKVATLD